MIIVHVISGLDSRAGGPPVAVAGLAKAQRLAGLEVAIIAGCREGTATDLAEEPRAAGVTVGVLKSCRGPLARSPELREVVPELCAQADVVHIHGVWEEIQHVAARAARASGVP